MCDGGQCVECEEDHHCASNEYCNNKDLPYILNQCTPKRANGQLCLQDRVSLIYKIEILTVVTLTNLR